MTPRRRRQTIRVRQLRFSLLFEPLPVVFVVVREVSVPNMIDHTTKWLAVPRTRADEVLARLEADGYPIDMQLSA